MVILHPSPLEIIIQDIDHQDAIAFLVIDVYIPQEKTILQLI